MSRIHLPPNKQHVCPANLCKMSQFTFRDVPNINPSKCKPLLPDLWVFNAAVLQAVGVHLLFVQTCANLCKSVQICANVWKCVKMCENV